MPSSAPALAGNTRHAYVVATNAPTLPLTIVAATNDTFQFNSVAYTIPPGIYTTIGALADAVNLSTGGTGGTLLPACVIFGTSRTSPTKLKATSVPQGVSVLAFAVGATHDGLVAIGFAAAQALAGGDPID